MTSSGTHTLEVRLTPGPDLGRLHLGFTRAGARPRHCVFFLEVLQVKHLIAILRMTGAQRWEEIHSFDDLNVILLF